MPMIRTGRVAKIADKDIPQQPVHVPYFAHQQLDVEKYLRVSLPLQVSPAGQAAERGRVTQASHDRDDNNGDSEACDNDESPQNTMQVTKRRRSSVPSPKGDAHKRQKITGGRPAVAKKVTAEMDSDDELIFSMKNAKYLEKDIAKCLQDEGRTVYNPKTIGTRWARLKKVMQAKQDEALDADLTDWHEGDDDVLYAGLDKAEEYIKEKIKQIEERRWRIVAAYVKGAKPVTNFSQKACQKRYEALQDGTAKPCPEFDPSPSSSRIARIQARQERQERIDRDAAAVKKGDRNETDVANIEANAWTSRLNDKFS